MTLMKSLLGATCALALTAGAALAEPAIIFDLGGKFDKSFNEAAFNGATVGPTKPAAPSRNWKCSPKPSANRRCAVWPKPGANPVVMTGFAFGDVLNKVAPDFPDTKFAIIDMVVEQPNVKSVVFNEHEGSYLVGMMAGMASKTGTVGFIGGMDIPLIRKFGCGYAQGVHGGEPRCQGRPEHDRHHAGGLERPGEGRGTGQGPEAQGADVIYAAAGGTGVGVLQAAADEGILSIGVDSNQNYLHPG